MKKGFTLIELLVVIGIIAILATITVLILNPAQLFAQARDSQRLSDLGTVKGAISLYTSTVVGPVLGASGFTCGTNFGSSIAGASSTLAATTIAHGGVLGIDGTGWVAVNFASTTGGSPLSSLPKDPVNTVANGYNYQYSCDSTNVTFELNANMESVRYSQGGADDVESTDGGNNPGIFETGTDPGLNI